VYDFPTSSEGWFLTIVDAEKKRQYTPLKIEAVTDLKRRSYHGSRLLRSTSESAAVDDPASQLDPRPIGSGNRDVKKKGAINGKNACCACHPMMSRSCVGSLVPLIIRPPDSTRKLVDRLLEIRDDPPEDLGRTPGRHPPSSII
jgi:hypothetical protein